MTNLPKRKNIRIEDYDYSTPGAYFITVCTANREKIFWNSVGADIIRPENVPLSIAGKIVEQGILQMAQNYENVVVDQYCIMPDHIHIIFIIPYKGPSRTPVPTPQNTALARFISTFKRFTNKECGQNIWQFRSYDHVIRDRRDLETKRKYIYENPTRRYYKDLESKYKTTETSQFPWFLL